jgi:hypothetical protein
MKKLLSVYFLVLGICLLPINNAFSDTGNDFLTWNELRQLYYMDGYYDGLLVFKDWANMSNNEPFSSCTVHKVINPVYELIRHWTLGQLVDVFIKWLKDNPGYRHHRLDSMIFLCFQQEARKQGFYNNNN